MRRILITLIGAVLILAGSALGAAAQEAGGAQAAQDPLKLTPEQTTKIEQIRKQHQAAMAKQQGDLIKARAEVAALRIQPEPDLRALQRAMDAESQLQNALQIQQMKNRKELEAVLTPEQLAARQGRGMRAMAGARMGAAGRAGMGVRIRQGRSGMRGARGAVRTAVRPGMRGMTGGRQGAVRRRAVGTPPPRGMSEMRQGAGFGRGMGVQSGAGFGRMVRQGIHAPGTGRTTPPPPPIDR